MKPTPRQWLAILLLGVFVYVMANLAPYFIANFRLGRYVEELTQSSDLRSRPPGAVQAQVAERAHQLGLPVQATDVQVELTQTAASVSVRYLVPVNLPGYTVKLHFAPSAGR